MNERIRELAKQAGYMEDGFGFGHWDMPECKKFAELIIQECIKLSQPPVEYPVDGTWIEKSYWEGCYDSSQRIKEHFGVEK